MTAYKKNLLAWSCIMGAELLIIVAILYVSSWFLVPFFIIIYNARYVLYRITCPNCGTPVTYQGTIAGFRIQGGFIHKKCQECGWDLDKEKQISLRGVES